MLTRTNLFCVFKPKNSEIRRFVYHKANPGTRQISEIEKEVVFEPHDIDSEIAERQSVVGYLSGEHQRLRTLFQTALTSPVSKEKRKYWNEIVREFSQHETIEEQVFNTLNISISVLTDCLSNYCEVDKKLNSH